MLELAGTKPLHIFILQPSQAEVKSEILSLSTHVYWDSRQSNVTTATTYRAQVTSTRKPCFLYNVVAQCATPIVGDRATRMSKQNDQNSLFLPEELTPSSRTTVKTAARWILFKLQGLEDSCITRQGLENSCIWRQGNFVLRRRRI